MKTVLTKVRNAVFPCIAEREELKGQVAAQKEDNRCVIERVYDRLSPSAARQFAKAHPSHG